MITTVQQLWNDRVHRVWNDRLNRHRLDFINKHSEFFSYTIVEQERAAESTLQTLDCIASFCRLLLPSNIMANNSVKIVYKQCDRMVVRVLHLLTQKQGFN